MPRQTQILALLTCVSGLAPAADVLSLDQAIRIALTGNRGIQSADLDVDKAADRLAATRTRQLPNFNLYALGAQQLTSFDFKLERGVLGTYEETGPLPSEDIRLETPRRPTAFVMGTVSQPLTSLIRIRRNMDTLKTGIEVAKEQTRSEQLKTIAEVKQVYYSLQQVESSLRSIRQTAELYGEVEKLTANYVAQEVALRGDLLEAQRRVAQARQMEVRLRNQEAAGKERLNQLLGRHVLTEFEVPPMLEAPAAEISVEEARTRAIAARPEIRQNRLRQTQAEQDVRAKQAEYIPDISAQVTSLSLVNFGSFLPVQSHSVGFSLSWEPFDGGRKKHEAAEKQRVVSQAELAVQEAQNLVLLDVNNKHRQLEYTRGELRVAQLAQETTVENLRVAKNKYAVESVLAKDVLQAQVALEQSNAEYQQALASFWTARAEFERALGEDR